MDALRAERAELAIADYNTYDPDAFPGSAQWRQNKAAREALATFDAAHPEIVEAIRTEQKAAEKAEYDGLSDFVKAGS